MRVGLIRSDLSRIYLDDVENTSQRNFSSQPPGQSRYFEWPTGSTLTSVLNQYAFLSVLGTSGSMFPLTLSGSNNVLTVKTSATVAAATVTLPSSGSYTAAQLVALLNPLFAAQGLLVVASVQGTAIQIDTVAPASPYIPSFATAYTLPSPPIGLSKEGVFVPPLNSGPTAYLQLGGTFQAAVDLSGSAFTGLPVFAPAAGATSLFGTSANAGVYQFTAISGQTGAAAATAATLGPNGTVTITGLTGMTANSTLHFLVCSGGSDAGNDGTFPIVQYISPTSVVIYNTAAVAGDSSITWHEDTLSFNISYSQIGALSTFNKMEGYSASTPTSSFLALATAIQNAVAPSLVETGPTLLSFAKGKLSILSASYFQPGYPVQNAYESPFGQNESAVARLGYAAGPAVYITENDGVTAYTL
jgi:hypothetical protein